MAFDLSDAMIVVSIVTALVALWVMQCVTRNAGFATGHGVSLLGLRLALAALAAALLYGAYTVSTEIAGATVNDMVLRLALLSFLCTLPFAVGGRRGAEQLSRR